MFLEFIDAHDFCEKYNENLFHAYIVLDAAGYGKNRIRDLYFFLEKSATVSLIKNTFIVTGS